MSTIDIDRESKKILLARLGKKFTKEVAQDIYDLLTPVDKAGRSTPESKNRLKIADDKDYKVGGLGANSDDISQIESYNRIPSDRARYAIYYFVEELLGLSELKLDPATIEIVEKKKKRKSKPEGDEGLDENETELTKYYAIAYGRTKQNQGALRYRLVISHTFMRLEARARRPNKSKTKSKQKPAYQAYWVPIRAARVKSSTRSEKYELVPYPETTIIFDKSNNTITEIKPDAAALRAWNAAIEIGKQNVIALAKNLRSECEQAIISLKTPVDALSESYIFRLFLQYNSLVYDDVKLNFLDLGTDKFSITKQQPTESENQKNKKIEKVEAPKSSQRAEASSKEEASQDEEATDSSNQDNQDSQGTSRKTKNQTTIQAYRDDQDKFSNQKKSVTLDQFKDILEKMNAGILFSDSFKIAPSVLNKYAQEIKSLDPNAEDDIDKSTVLLGLLLDSDSLGKNKGMNAKGLELELTDGKASFRPLILLDAYNKDYGASAYNARIVLAKSLYFKIHSYDLIASNINWASLKNVGSTIGFTNNNGSDSSKWQITDASSNRLLAGSEKSTFKRDSLKSIAVKELLIAKLKNPESSIDKQQKAVRAVMDKHDWTNFERTAESEAMPKLEGNLTLPSIWLGDGLIDVCYETIEGYSSFDLTPPSRTRNPISFRACILGGKLNEIHILICSNTSVKIRLEDNILQERNKIDAFTAWFDKVELKATSDILFYVKSTLSYDSSSSESALKYDLLRVRQGIAVYSTDGEVESSIVNWALYIQLLPYMLGQLTGLVGCYVNSENKNMIITDNKNKIKLYVAKNLIDKEIMSTSSYPVLPPFFNNIQLSELLNMFLMNSTNGGTESIDIDMPSSIPVYPKNVSTK